MSPQMESIVQTIRSFKEALVLKQAEVQDEPHEILDEDTFCAILSGLPSFRKLPGVPEHMGFDLIYHCDTPENKEELRNYLESVFGIKDEDSLVTQKHEFFHIFNEYYDFACEWDGHPNFPLDDLDEDGRSAYIKSRDFSVNLRDFVGSQGYAGWDIGERIMLIRAACACGIISDDACRHLVIDEARVANELFDNFVDFAISSLCGAVYFIFVSMGRNEDEGISGFLDINMKIVSKLMEDDIWSFNAWCEKNYKQLAIQDDQIQQLLGPEYRGITGIASDHVLCDGYRISVMFREKPLSNADSGWRFFAGDENDEYLNNHRNFGALELNLICNYAPDAIEFLELPVGTFVARDADGKFQILRETLNADGNAAPNGQNGPVPPTEPIAFG